MLRDCQTKVLLFIKYIWHFSDISHHKDKHVMKSDSSFKAWKKSTDWDTISEWVARAPPSPPPRAASLRGPPPRGWPPWGRLPPVAPPPHVCRPAGPPSRLLLLLLTATSTPTRSPCWGRRGTRTSSSPPPTPSSSSESLKKLLTPIYHIVALVTNSHGQNQNPTFNLRSIYYWSYSIGAGATSMFIACWEDSPT